MPPDKYLISERNIYQVFPESGMVSGIQAVQKRTGKCKFLETGRADRNVLRDLQG